MTAPIEDNAQRELLTAYANFVNSADGQLILNDLNVFAQQETENPVVRCGRLDIFSRIMRQGRRIKESTPPPRAVKGRASVLGESSEE